MVAPAPSMSLTSAKCAEGKAAYSADFVRILERTVAGFEKRERKVVVSSGVHPVAGIQLSVVDYHLRIVGIRVVYAYRSQVTHLFIGADVE